MKTTAGIMPSLRSIARANESWRDAKRVWAQPCVVNGRGEGGWGVVHKVSALQVQAWQLPFPDQRLLGTDPGHRTATACLKDNVTWEQTPGHPANQPIHHQDHDSTAYEKHKSSQTVKCFVFVATSAE